MALAKLSIVHGNLGNIDKARAYSAKAVDKAGNLPPGERFYIEGRHYSLDPASIDKAVVAYQKAVDDAPDHTAARNNLAQLLLELRRYPEALVHLEELRRRGMTFPGTYMSLAQAYVATGRPDQAREALASYAAEHPDRAASYENLAYFELTQGRTEAALAEFDKAAGLHPDDSMKIETGRFAAHALRDEWPQAEAAAKRLMASDDPRQRWEGGATLAMASLYRGDVGEARRLAAEGARTGRNPEERVGARLFGARLEADLGRDREALAEAEGVLREKVKEPKLLAQGHAMKAICLTRLGRKAEAEKSLAQVEAFLSTIPRPLAEPERLHLEGEIALARGDHGAARAALEKAAALAPVDGLKMDDGAGRDPVRARAHGPRGRRDRRGAQGAARGRRRGTGPRHDPGALRAQPRPPRRARGEGRPDGGRAPALRALPRLLEGRPDRPRRGGPRGPAPGLAPVAPRGLSSRMTPAAAALLAALAAPSGPAPAVLRYDLRPGDHLVYRQRLERGIRSASVDSRSEAEWESHVLVLAERGGSWRVGIQRNRTRAELLRYREDGRDRLESERPAFVEGLAKRGTAFAETSWLTPSGAALLPWAAVREATSERLPLFHEIEPLPAAAVAPGGSFASPGLLGRPMKAVGAEAVAGEQCLRLEGEIAGIKIRHWHCASSGTLGRLEYEAQYGGPGGAEVTEQYRLERVSLGRGEALASWLRDAKTARGALTTLAATDRLDVAPQTLYALLDGADSDVERLVLAVAWRHRLAPPPADVLRRLAASPSPRVAAIASRFLDAPTRPKAPDELVRLARAVRSGAALPAWNGPIEAGWGRKALLAQRAPGQVPGTTLRLMRTERFRGRPYVLHVPDDYRGDEPFPLVVVLGGGPGRAIPTAQTARSSLEPRGALAAFPQANGMWWEEEPAAAVEALLAEVLGDLNVDTDRVTLTGFSNGGTGSILYASRTPHRFAAVASLMGGGLPFFEGTDPVDAAAIACIPFLFVHGDRDELIPSWASERTARAMRKANPGAVAEVHVLPGRPHDVVYGRDEGLTFPFLEKQAREPFPRQVSLRARTLEHPRAFWAEVLEKGGGVAEIDGTIERGTIALRTRNVKRLRLLLRRELVDLPAPVRVTVDGREAFLEPVAEDPALLLRSWRETGDPQLAHSAEITLDVR